MRQTPGSAKRVSVRQYDVTDDDRVVMCIGLDAGS